MKEVCAVSARRIQLNILPAEIHYHTLLMAIQCIKKKWENIKIIEPKICIIIKLIFKIYIVVQF